MTTLSVINATDYAYLQPNHRRFRLVFSVPFSYTGGSVLSSLYPSLISFSSLTFPGSPYRIFLLLLLWLPRHFYIVVMTTTRVSRLIYPSTHKIKVGPGFPPRKYSSRLYFLCHLAVGKAFPKTLSFNLFKPSYK